MCLLSFTKSLSFRTRLIFSYIILLAVSIGIIGYKYYDISMWLASSLERENVYEIVKKNNQIVDTKLSKIKESSLAMTIDQVLYDLFNQINPKDGYELVKYDQDISNVINKYFPPSQDIYSVSIVTSYYTFGQQSPTSFIPVDNFARSRLYSEAIASKGKMTWVPTYDFTQMYNQKNLEGINLEYKYLFSAVRLINSSYIENGAFLTLDKHIERPVLIVNFKEDLFQKIFENSIPIKGTYFLVASSDGHIVSHQDQSELATIDKSDWLARAIQKKSGTDFVTIDGRKMIICYDTIRVTDWLSVAVIPVDNLMANIIPTIKFYTIYLSLIIILISLFVAYLISGRITKPISKLLIAIKQVGEGNFDIKVPGEGNDEFGNLIKKFNDMNEKIIVLIKENYEVKLREKEAEIMALNLQLNPHFLYNTLNILNWMAINNEKDNMSRMIVSLSTMLHYTTDNTEETTILGKDLEWLKSYLFIMTQRFKDRYFVEYYINPVLESCKVPKLFLQPFIENSLIHGFRHTDSGGVVKVYGWIQDQNAYFSVVDNGCGMNREILDKILHGETNTVGIRNVDKRIKLLYGTDYGVKIESKPEAGTYVTITIPYTTETYNVNPII